MASWRGKWLDPPRLKLAQQETLRSSSLGAGDEPLRYFTSFWNKHPAFYYGLSALFACYAAIDWDWVIFFLFILLCISSLFGCPWRAGLCCAFGVTFFCLVKTSFDLPDEDLGKHVKAEIDITNIISSKRHFGTLWTYRATLNHYYLENGQMVHANIPILLPFIETPHVQRPSGCSRYIVEGILAKNERGYVLNKTTKVPWQPIAKSWSLAEKRFDLKKSVKKYLKNRLENDQSLKFLQGIATGEFDDKHLMFEFSRFGLQHIMAISGFHFAILAMTVSTLFQLIFSRKIAAWLAVLLLSGYFFFLGPSPSVMRAWIATVIALGSILVEKRALGLNSLGVGLIGVLTYDPWMSCQLGFQFSFAVTGSILLFSPLCQTLLNQIFEFRPLNTILRMNMLNQHGCLAIILIKQSLALSLAVNLTALPMALYFFHKIPVLSLLYNLFFPFLASFSIILLIIASLMDLSFLPLLAKWIHYLNDSYTQWILDLIFLMPANLDFIFRLSEFSATWLQIYLALAIIGGIYLRGFLQNKKQESWELTFV